ncbi:CoF synthetase [Cohnella caldifontis]|uniref:CoF synthetase n=1 Tax=Cohnella caldifontis TaxID=3027471 RepID=UPI0023EB777E|nr:CoF synthetase [Cohnella sp. YIM B05605]
MNDDAIVIRMALETASRFPWYAKLLNERPEPEGSRLPPLLTARRLEPYYESAPRGLAAGVSLNAYSTSGTSSGRRKTIYYSPEDERQYIEIKARMFAEWLAGGASSVNGEDSGHPARHGNGIEGGESRPFRKVLSDMGTGHAAATAPEVFESIGLACESLSFELPIVEHLKKLEALRPDVLYTMPSILDRILAAAGDASRFGIRRIILVGEIAPPAWQRKIAARFGIRETDILDTCGSIEIGTIAGYDHSVGRYVLAEGLTAECVSAEELGENFDPLPPDEKVLVLTSEVREAFPAVRYVTYDVVRDFRTMTVRGVQRQTFAGIVKRIGPELKHGEKISLYDIEEAVLLHADDADIRVEVNGRKLSVRLRSAKLTAEKLPAVRQSIEEKIPAIGAMIRGGLLDAIEVALELVAGSGPAQKGIKTRKIHYGETE